VDGHKSHDISSIPQARDREIEKLLQAFEVVNKLETTLTSALSDLEAFKCEIRLKADEKISNITSLYRDIINIINERETLLKQGITNTLQKEESNLQRTENSIKEQLANIKLFKESIADVQSESACKLLSKARACKDLLSKANTTPPSISFSINFGEVKKDNELTTLWKILNPGVVHKQGPKFYNTTVTYNNKKTNKVALIASQ
jgi:virulence-associated protein VapD